MDEFDLRPTEALIDLTAENRAVALAVRRGANNYLRLHIADADGEEISAPTNLSAVSAFAGPGRAAEDCGGPRADGPAGRWGTARNQTAGPPLVSTPTRMSRRAPW